MNKIIFDATILKYMSVFSYATKVQPRDCINDELGVLFIVPQGEIARALGTGGRNIRHVENIIKKKVRVLEFQDNLIMFLEHLSYPARVKEIRQDQDTVFITALDGQSRGQLIGRNASNLRHMESIAKRYFTFKEIKVN